MSTMTIGKVVCLVPSHVLFKEEIGRFLPLDGADREFISQPVDKKLGEPV